MADKPYNGGLSIEALSTIQEAAKKVMTSSVDLLLLLGTEEHWAAKAYASRKGREANLKSQKKDAEGALIELASRLDEIGFEGAKTKLNKFREAQEDLTRPKKPSKKRKKAVHP